MISKIFMPQNGDTMKKIYIWTVMAGLIYAGSSFVMSMVTTSLLGAYAGGVLALAMSTIGNQLATIGLFNTRMYQVSDITEEYSFADYINLRIFSVGVMLLYGAGWMILDGYSGEKLIIIISFTIFKACETVSDLFEGRYQQKHRYDVSCRGVFYKTLLYLVAFLGFMIVTKSLMIASIALTVTYLVTILIVDSQLLPKFGKIHFEIDWHKLGKLIAECLPLFINSFLTMYVLNASKLSMDKYFGEEYLGIFNPLYMMAFVINMFAAFALKPLITILSTKYVDGDIKGFVGIMRRQVLIITGIIVAALIGAWFLGTTVLTLFFGIDLHEYRTELLIMLVGGAFTAIYQLFQYGVIIMRHQISCLIGSVITAVFAWFITPILVRRYEIKGAAWAFLCSMAFMSLILFILNWYFLRKEKSTGE